MSKSRLALFAAAFVATAAVADDMKAQGMMMDANHDGMISKQEYMKYHEGMWSKMTKNKSGMVDMRELEKMQTNMSKDGAMMKDGTRM